MYSGESENVGVVNSDVNCFISSSGNEDIGKGSTPFKATQTVIKNMPMSIKSAEDQLNLLASFLTCYDNCIKGKIIDPALREEDYDHIDLDDWEEMDL